MSKIGSYGCIYDRVYRLTRLMVWQAYKEVKSNAGNGGIDNVDWKYLEQNQRTELYKLWNLLSSGSYFPQAVKQVAIPKKGGGIRYFEIFKVKKRCLKTKY